MIHTNAYDFNSIISSGEKLYKLAKDFDITGLEKKIPEYTRTIQQHFVNLDEKKLTYSDVEDIKKIMSLHKMIASLLNRKKEEISSNLKQLHYGKKLKNTYPQTHY
jgi:uncharacterized protein with ACT and thioredoxin-like domain